MFKSFKGWVLRFFNAILRRKVASVEGSRKLHVRDESPRTHRGNLVQAYKQRNGRFSNERWMVLGVDRSNRATIRSLMRPHVVHRRMLDRLIPDGHEVVFAT